MQNPYEIRRDKELFYLIDHKQIILDNSYLLKECAIFINLFYEEEIDKYFKYLDCLEHIDVYIISSNQSLISKIRNRYLGRTNITVLNKEENSGRDISSLLIELKKIYSNYKHICFLHDKKEHYFQEKKNIDLWIQNIWGNLIGQSEKHINQVINIFEENEKLGVLFPPDPIGDTFCTWYGMGWHGSYNTTKRLVEKLNLKCNISEEYPPLGMGTALWFRTEALKKLFDYDWKYKEFDDSQLNNPDYFSYAVERIFPFVAQDAGYDTGEIISVEYLRTQMIIIKEETRIIFNSMYDYYPFPIAANSKHIRKNINNLVKFASENSYIYLYGAGRVGRFCLGELRKNGLLPLGFIETKSSLQIVDNLEVLSIESFQDTKSGIVITPIKKGIQDEIISILKTKGISNYHIFWTED